MFKDETGYVNCAQVRMEIEYAVAFKENKEVFMCGYVGLLKYVSVLGNAHCQLVPA